MTDIAKRHVTGRALEHFTTRISRELIKTLKDPILRSNANRGNFKYRLGPTGMEFLEELERVRYILVHIWTNDLTEKCTVTGSYVPLPEEGASRDRPRSCASDIFINIDLPKYYSWSIFSDLIPELKATIRHELEHSAQSLGLLNAIKGYDFSIKHWENNEAYLCSEIEVQAWVAGLYKRAKVLKRPIEEIVEEEIADLRQRHFGCAPRVEINRMAERVRGKWRAYLAQRYFLE